MSFDAQNDITVIIEVRNLSATNHPFHMHGHAFQVIARNGVITIFETLRLRVELTKTGWFIVIFFHTPTRE